MIFNNRDGSKWIELTKSILLFKPYNKTRFYFPQAGVIKRFKGFRNCRFKIKRGNKRKIVWTIKVPFFYWERDNNSWKFGNNTFYLWWHIARIK